MLFIAHDLSMVRYVSDRMAVMYLGTIVELGAADQVFFNPQHPYTKILVGSNPEPDPKLERSRNSTSIQGEIPTPVNVPAGCRFANRCPQVMEKCRSQTPELVTVQLSEASAGASCQVGMSLIQLTRTGDSTEPTTDEFFLTDKKKGVHFVHLLSAAKTVLRLAGPTRVIRS